MKNIILLCTLFVFANISIFGQTNSDKEVVILRVNQFLKTNGLESRLYIEIGNSPNHSFKGKVENGEAGTVRYTKNDGMVSVFTNEVDMLSFLINNGYKILNVYENNIGSRPFVNYIMEKTIILPTKTE